MKNSLNIFITISLGAFFGWVLIASQAISWYRIQEMFYFESFHMYGLLGSAILTAFIGLFLIRKLRLKTLQGNIPVLKQKPFTWKANALGGVIFGLGWGLSGACSAPLFIWFGLSWQLGLILIAGALAGTWLYAMSKDSLPH